MSQLDLALIDAKTAAEVCRRIPLSEEARALVRADLTPRPFLDLLIEKQHHLDGIRFLAHAMVKRAVVWWAYQCVTQVLGPEPPAAVAKALEAARAWVSDPSEDNRRPCWPAAEAADIGTPAGCTAMAAYLQRRQPRAAQPARGCSRRRSHRPHGDGRLDARRRDQRTRESRRETGIVPQGRLRDRRRQESLADATAGAPRGPPAHEETIGDANGTASRSRW